MKLLVKEDRRQNDEVAERERLGAKYSEAQLEAADAQLAATTGAVVDSDSDGEGDDAE